MNTVIIIVILIVIGGAGYYFYSRSNSSSPSPNSLNPATNPPVNNNMIGIWEVNQYNSDGSLTDNNYTLNFQSDGRVIASTNQFPLTNMSWTPTTWSGTMSSGQQTTLPLTYSNNAISLYVNNKSGASPYIVLKPTPSPTTPSPTTPSPTTPSPTTQAPTTPSPTTTPTPTTSSVATSSPSSTVTPTIGPFKPTSPPVENVLGVTGQKIKLKGGTLKQILNICSVDIFPDPYNSPYPYSSSIVTASSTDPDHKSLSNFSKGDYFATLATDENPYISIDLGADLPIYKIVVYNRVDDRVQRICGLTLTITNSKLIAVYTSDGVICTQLATNSDKSLQKGVISKNNVMSQDSAGNPISGKTFNDYGNKNNDLAIYSNTGTIVYFPTAGKTDISQGPPMNIFRGKWVDENRDNFLIIRTDGTLTRVKNGAVITGVYQQFGFNAYVVLEPPQTTYYTGTLSGWCKTNDRFPISSAEIQYSGVEYNPSTKIYFANIDDVLPACSSTGPDVMTIGAGFLKYKDVKYYRLYTTDWYCYGDINIEDVTKFNKNIKLDFTNKLTLSQRIGRLSLKALPNPYIGSWMTNDLPNPVIFTFNPDMTCSDGDGTYEYRFLPPKTSTTSIPFVSLAFRKNKSEYQLDCDCVTYEINYVSMKVITDGGFVSSNIKLLRNPFLGTWTSKVKRSPITFTINATVGFEMVGGFPQDQYWVNPPNGEITSIFGAGYITGSVKGNPTRAVVVGVDRPLSTNNLVIAYDIDSDIIYVYIAESYEKPVDTLTR